MTFLVSVQPLRARGKRLASAGAPVDGYLRSERRGGSLALTLISQDGGTELLGPLFDARLSRASLEGMVLIGFERADDAAFVQEWSLGAFSGRGRATGWMAAAQGRTGL